eukprot:768272-Hanusia_phi.AAC.1
MKNNPLVIRITDDPGPAARCGAGLSDQIAGVGSSDRTIQHGPCGHPIRCATGGDHRMEIRSSRSPIIMACASDWIMGRGLGKPRHCGMPGPA